MNDIQLHEAIKEQLKKDCLYAIAYCKELLKVAEDQNLTNEDFYLKFEDALNKISVTDHNNK